MSLPDATVNKNLTGQGARARAQRAGAFLASMIMPNIGAFIAWGFITALFIPAGWWPNATLAEMVGPMITYLLPILIGYTGGRVIHGQRGAVIGAIATFGVIVGAGIPMFLGAMIMGPLAAYLLKKFDQLIEGRVRTGFEMLVDNFSIGILGALLAALARFAIQPIVEGLIHILGQGVGFLVNQHLLPLVSLLVEPAKVLFLNNAINHGVLSPLGAAESLETGRSILFMVETNPGPGLGLLLAFMFFGPRTLRPSTPGAIIIHLFGGIHEIYFPYVLMKPRMLLAVIAGGMAGMTTAMVLKAGLVGPPAPGSIIAYFLVTPRGGHLAMIASVLAATAVSFLVAAALFRFGKSKDVNDSPAGVDATVDTPAVAAGQAVVTPGATGPTTARRSINGRDVRTLVIACDAGMGSSVMVAGQMRKKLAPYGVTVTHTPVAEIPTDASLVMTQSGLADRARGVNPDAVIVAFEQFIGDPAFTRVENAIRNGENIE